MGFDSVAPFIELSQQGYFLSLPHIECRSGDFQSLACVAGGRNVPLFPDGSR
jgi:hypothetical protein